MNGRPRIDDRQRVTVSAYILKDVVKALKKKHPEQSISRTVAEIIEKYTQEVKDEKIKPKTNRRKNS